VEVAVKRLCPLPLLCLVALPAALLKRVLTSSIDKTLGLWDAYTGKCLCVFKGHSPDARRGGQARAETP
jgi:hypothetical protein